MLLKAAHRTRGVAPARQATRMEGVTAQDRQGNTSTWDPLLDVVLLAPARAGGVFIHFVKKGSSSASVVVQVEVREGIESAGKLQMVYGGSTESTLRVKKYYSRSGLTPTNMIVWKIGPERKRISLNKRIVFFMSTVVSGREMSCQDLLLLQSSDWLE